MLRATRPPHRRCRREQLDGLFSRAGGDMTDVMTEIREQTGSESDFRPFRVDIPDQDLSDLRRRLQAARWPTKELVEDRSQGVQLATLRELARYWTTEYDWRECETRLNALPQFTTEIDGVE